MRKWSKSVKFILLCLFLVGLVRLQGQTFALPFSLSQSSPSLTFALDSNGTFTETGPLNTSATLTFASNPQMVWMPAFAAFRAGQFTGSQTSIGEYSAAFGNGDASGEYSLATGGAAASSYFAVAFGTYNSDLSETGSTPSSTSWVSSDPLFEIGNGSNSTTLSDAFVVYKNGNAAVQGVLTVSPGGDIPMYQP